MIDHIIGDGGRPLNDGNDPDHLKCFRGRFSCAKPQIENIAHRPTVLVSEFHDGEAPLEGISKCHQDSIGGTFFFDFSSSL